MSFIFSSCKSAGLLFTEDGEIECGGDGKAIILSNNPKATNPTFNELIAFIKGDGTDNKVYIKDGPDAYVCSDFAEEVHNNAEAAGIRSGWVGITFEGTEEGHAINDFETTDRGLVYIDCTNGGNNEIHNWDTIAYIQKGDKYGVIHVDRAESLGYNYYVEYEKKWQDYRELLETYNEEVKRYNDEINDKVYTPGSPEEISIRAWKESLDQQAEALNGIEDELGNNWYESEFSSYMVKSLLIHW